MVVQELLAWEKALDNTNINDILDGIESRIPKELRSGEPPYSGVRLVLPMEAMSNENESEFGNKIRAEIDKRLHSYKNMTKWNLYKKSLKDFKLWRFLALGISSIPLLTTPLMNLYGNSPDFTTYLISGAVILATMAICEPLYFYVERSNRNDCVKVLEYAKNDVFVTYRSDFQVKLKV